MQHADRGQPASQEAFNQAQLVKCSGGPLLALVGLVIQHHIIDAPIAVSLCKAGKFFKIKGLDAAVRNVNDGLDAGLHKAVDERLGDGARGRRAQREPTCAERLQFGQPALQVCGAVVLFIRKVVEPIAAFARGAGCQWRIDVRLHCAAQRETASLVILPDLSTVTRAYWRWVYWLSCTVLRTV